MKHFDFAEDSDLLAADRKAHRKFYPTTVKRALDIILVLLGSLVVFPLVLLLALIVSIDGGAPFYFSARVGRGGRVFRMLKLRTMVPNAHDILDAYLASHPEAAAEWAHHQKLKFDPRITPVGRLLRKTSLDELPQLWNVLVGDMSLVGPRPMMPDQRSLYPSHVYYLMRPGVTGPWQVSARNGSSFSERAVFDRDYYSSMSLTGDVKLIGKTVGVMLRATGH